MPYKIYGDKDLFASFEEAKDALINRIALAKGREFENYYEDYEQDLIDEIVDEMSESELRQEFEKIYDPNHEFHARFDLMIRRYPTEDGSTKYAVWDHISKEMIQWLSEREQEHRYKMEALSAEEDEDWFETWKYLQENPDEKEWDPINFVPPSEHVSEDDDINLPATSERYKELIVCSLDPADCTDCKDYEDRDDLLYYRSLILHYERELEVGGTTSQFMHQDAGTLFHVFMDGYHIYDEEGIDFSPFSEEDEFNRLIEKFRHREFMRNELEEIFGVKLGFGWNNCLIINDVAIEDVSWGLPVDASEQQQQTEKLKLTIEAYLSKRK